MTGQRQTEMIIDRDRNVIRRIRQTNQRKINLPEKRRYRFHSHCFYR